MRRWACVARPNSIATRAGLTARRKSQLSYPGMATRLVDKNGKLSWKDQRVFLTSSLAGWQVGLQRTEKGQLEIWFGRLLLGHLDPQELDFLELQGGGMNQHEPSWG